MNVNEHKHNIYIAAYVHRASADIMIAFSRSQQHALSPKATLDNVFASFSSRCVGEHANITMYSCLFLWSATCMRMYVNVCGS